MAHVCPWWHAYLFDNALRRIFFEPGRMFGPYVSRGMTALDVGCGMGFNSIALARLVGDKGRVIAVDVEPKMLAVLAKRARRAGVLDRIDVRQSTADAIGVTEKVGFAVAFWVAHEVPDAARFLRQVRSCLVSDAKFMIVEPKGVVSAEAFRHTLSLAEGAGLRMHTELRVHFSRAAVLERSERGRES